MDTPQTPLDYEAWYNANEQDLTCMAAESGADRERGFDSEAFAEEQYEKYLKEFKPLRLTQDDITDDFLERVEEDVGMGKAAWDCVGGKNLIASVLNVYAKQIAEERL